MTAAELEVAADEAVAWARKQGFRVAQGVFGLTNRDGVCAIDGQECCALGALAASRRMSMSRDGRTDGYAWTLTIGCTLDIRPTLLGLFAAGFDGDDRRLDGPEERDFYDAGRRVAVRCLGV